MEYGGESGFEELAGFAETQLPAVLPLQSSGSVLFLNLLLFIVGPTLKAGSGHFELLHFGLPHLYTQLAFALLLAAAPPPLLPTHRVLAFQCLQLAFQLEDELLELQTDLNFLFAQSVPSAVGSSHLPSDDSGTALVSALGELRLESGESVLSLFLAGLQRLDECEVVVESE
jgi:hypothetical protein